jgi:hypothetical protein
MSELTRAAAALAAVAYAEYLGGGEATVGEFDRIFLETRDASTTAGGAIGTGFADP